MLKNTGLFGLGVTAYATLGFGVASGLSALVGLAGSIAYLVMLGQYVDSIEGRLMTDQEDELYGRNLAGPASNCMWICTDIQYLEGYDEQIFGGSWVS